MEWTEICLKVATADTDAASAIANMVVPYGIYVEDYSDLEQGAREIAHIDLIDEALLQKDRTHSLIHAYISPEENPLEAIAFLRERLTAAQIAHEVSSESITEQDWANNWKTYFKPLTVGQKLWICPTWTSAAVPDGRTMLSIDPGMAFGTGGHDTTRLMLEAIEPLVTPDTTVLDIGCGSGILSIAAMLLGAKQAVGVDIDPLAVKTAIANGQENGLTEPAYTMVQGDLAKTVTGQYDLVVANIVADAIISLTPAVAPFLNKNGRYLVSGIIDTREQDVVTVLKDNGWIVEQRLEQKGWICMVCRRNGV